jgi:hypothetical protein
MSRVVSASALQIRPLSDRDTDASALRAVAQAAINVELFTIPLYMATLYSIQGTHPITGKNDFYAGRLWPGPDPSATPDTANKQAFNIMFSVFIEEMLHLQLASNIATALGVKPTFTSAALQDARHGWTCYGPDKTVIPHIVDLLDTTDDRVRVNLGPLTRPQLDLFLAIEEPENEARKRIRRGNYFPKVPFAGWTRDKTENDLPMFGTIGRMYQCYYDYMNLRFDNGDGTTSTLFEYVFDPNSVQKDMFNVASATEGHPEAEYPLFGATIDAKDCADAFSQGVDMMDAITDQGEGSLIKRSRAFKAVQPRYQADEHALTVDYPDYTDAGKPGPIPPADAVARAGNDSADHYERFMDVARNIHQVETWPDWFAKGHRWTAADLQTTPTDAVIENPYDLPTPQAIAQALNNMADPVARDANFKLLSHAAAGSIAGVTTVLNDYWSNPKTGFPYPSMVGAGDRMAICWAIFGQAPDLGVGIGVRDQDTLYHTCQALGIESPGQDCAAVVVFHACRGSNNCKAEGGCGFVQPATGGGHGCGPVAFKAKTSATDGDAGETSYSAPSDNKCATFGGCASPISASQIMPAAVDAEGNELHYGTMLVFNFGTGPEFEATEIGRLLWMKGEKVHDVAYKAYRQVMQARGVDVPGDPPPPNDLRLAFPPST